VSVARSNSLRQDSPFPALSRNRLDHPPTVYEYDGDSLSSNQRSTNGHPPFVSREDTDWNSDNYSQVSYSRGNDTNDRTGSRQQASHKEDVYQTEYGNEPYHTTAERNSRVPSGYSPVKSAPPPSSPTQHYAEYRQYPQAMQAQNALHLSEQSYTSMKQVVVIFPYYLLR